MEGGFCALAEVSQVEKAVGEKGKIVEAIEMSCEQIDAFKEVCRYLCGRDCSLTVENVLFERYRGSLTNTEFPAVVINRDVSAPEMALPSVSPSFTGEP